jgi:DNA-binding GntR family transcriptional regulator
MVGQVGNPLLTKMVLQLRDDMRLYGIDSAEGLKQQKVAVQEHYQMIELAAKGDVQQIGDLISLHILTWKPLFKAALERLA